MEQNMNKSHRKISLPKYMISIAESMKINIFNLCNLSDKSVNDSEKYKKQKPINSKQLRKKHGIKGTMGTQRKVTPPQKLNNLKEDLDTISDELFKKLEKILDEAESESSSESKTSVVCKPQDEHSGLPDDHK